ncbi:MAG TPA: hypothetical protein VE954_05025 [Oligoflexus sp.]|uniref:hypothetical protein n=1 Tax=Oligoflexus sp. TaxID=1971216 RepID=UPI002D45BE0F|nr:hypothetical protein [Oligoflexus sp.]HYX32454.1 hypothetical protein [Oligoflexus sp.]
MLKILLFVLFANAAYAGNTSFLNETETANLVHEIDNVCGDSWCAGDVNYRFEKLVCQPSECYFDVSLWPRNEGNEQDRRQYRCELKGFTSRNDLLRDATYSDKLYDAVSSCIQNEITVKFPLIYVPMASSCLNSLLQKPYYASAAHSAYTDVFHETPDAAQASSQTLGQMIEAYAKTDSSCSLQWYAAFKDTALCERIAGLGAVCSLATDQGRYVVLKDYVDGAAVIYSTQKSSIFSLGQLKPEALTVRVPDPGLCYTELLNFDGKQKPSTPSSSLDHRSYYVSAQGLSLKSDARSNAAELITRTVTSLHKQSPKSCKLKSTSVNLPANVCKNMAGVDVCVIASTQTGGYYIVTKADANGAFVTFVRYD